MMCSTATNANATQAIHTVMFPSRMQVSHTEIQKEIMDMVASGIR